MVGRGIFHNVCMCGGGGGGGCLEQIHGSRGQPWNHAGRGSLNVCVRGGGFLRVGIGDVWGGVLVGC